MSLRNGSYAAAIASTRETMVARAGHYRWLVVAVVVLCVSAGIGAFAGGGWRALTMLSLLPGCVLVFCAADGMTIRRWRDGILAPWSRGALDLPILFDTLRQMTDLPAPSLNGMLATLPEWKAGEESAATRLALWRSRQAVDRENSLQVLVLILAWLVVAGALCAAAVVNDVRPLLAACVGLVCVIPLRMWQRRRMRRVPAGGLSLKARLPTRPPE